MLIIFLPSVAPIIQSLSANARGVLEKIGFCLSLLLATVYDFRGRIALPQIFARQGLMFSD